MATWVTHFMIADALLERFPTLNKRSFCVGNIAPDCNVENEDWTTFTPSREITHWMQGKRKVLSDCDAFCSQYILIRKNQIASAEEYDFLIGYYVHLITDAAFQAMIRDENRVKTVWKRIHADNTWSSAATGMEETWDSVKKLIPDSIRQCEIHSMEAQYLSMHPTSGYLTEILPLKDFPDYIDYLPKGSIVRKIGIMGYLPNADESIHYIAISPDEYTAFVNSTVQLAAKQLISNRLL